MSYNNELPFFEQLRRGVTHIETEVKELKQLVENGFNRNSDINTQDLIKAQQFDKELRKTYVEVTTLYNTIKGSPIHLNGVQNEIQNMRKMLEEMENDSGLKSYGYKPWVNEESKSSDDQLTNNLETISVNIPVIEKSTPEITINTKLLTNGMTQKSNASSEQTLETAKYIDLSEAHEEVKESNNKVKANKMDKYLGRTPQPYDFGITRRFTCFAPQLLLNNNQNKYKSIDKTPEAPTFDSTNTCRFNYLTTGFNLQSGQNFNTAITPPNASHTSLNGADSFVTVEFTPGLTTKRPKGISRVKDNQREEKTFQPIKHFPQVLQSVENEKITPEQPIPSTNTTKSAKMLRTIPGNNSGTPPLPQTRVNVNLHNKLLMKK